MNKKEKFSIYNLFMFLFLLIIVISMLYPFIYMVSVSLSKDIYIMRSQVTLFPKGFNLKMYKLVLSDKIIYTAYANTILYVLTGTTISLIITVSGAFALSKNRVIFHKFFTFMIIITMFFGGGMIPTYLTVRNLGMLDSIWAVILPGAVSTWNLIITRSFFDQFPNEIEEAGKIDGLNDIGVLWYLVLPVSTAVLATIGLFYAVAQWNAFFGPFIYLTTQSKFPLQLILQQLLSAGSSNSATVSGDSTIVEESLKYATVIVSMAPIIAVYPFLQKYFVKGVMIGSVKG
jgi:putative aldouronate transport system permease protein